MTVTEVSDRIETFIRDEILYKRKSVQLTQDTSLVNGLIDSLGMARLVTFLEMEFDVAIEHRDMVPGNFRTVRDIAALVQRKTTGEG